MIKRSLDRSFLGKVPALTKRCTIRNKPWPLGQQIMLYHWTAIPYKSPHENICPIIVDAVTPIHITHDRKIVHFHTPLIEIPFNLWELEGFTHPASFQAWFLSPKAKLKPHITHEKFLHFFHPAP